MYLEKISLLNFKNIAQEELAFCPGINCLVGDNGAGKTTSWMRSTTCRCANRRSR